MAERCVAILSPGDMGHAVGAFLAGRGFRVITALDGRSELTHESRERCLSSESVETAPRCDIPRRCGDPPSDRGRETPIRVG